jgi:hypothetical protein
VDRRKFSSKQKFASFWAQPPNFAKKNKAKNNFFQAATNSNPQSSLGAIPWIHSSPHGCV